MNATVISHGDFFGNFDKWSQKRYVLLLYQTQQDIGKLGRITIVSHLVFLYERYAVKKEHIIIFIVAMFLLFLILVWQESFH